MGTEPQMMRQVSSALYADRVSRGNFSLGWREKGQREVRVENGRTLSRQRCQSSPLCGLELMAAISYSR